MRGAGRVSTQAVSGVDAVPETEFDAASSAFAASHPEKLKVLAHPIRLKILKQAQLGEISAKEASRDLHEPIGKVSYHVRVLADAGLLELTRQTPRRGAIESHYRATIAMDLDDDAWNTVGSDVRRLMLAAAAKEWAADLLGAVESGGFEFPGALLANAHLVADDEGLIALREAMDAHYVRLLEIEADIAGRLAAGPDTDLTEVNIGLAFYEGAHTAAANAPFFARQGGPAFPLIPGCAEGQ